MLAKDYADMITQLNHFEVDYVVVGAYAMSVFGYTRATGDIDILSNPEENNVEKLWLALEAFGAPLSEVTKEDFLKEGTVFQIGIAPLRIDILTAIDGVRFDNIQVEYHITDDLDIPYIDLQSLIKNKRSTGRLRDLADCEELEKRL
ncbi:MAG: hypothetical protein R8M14_07580 [Ghiorsea sp.]